MHPKELKIIDFNYDLPQDKIATYPLAERDQSKLLVYKNGKIEVDTYKNIDEHLPSETLLVFNNTKVVEARILFPKDTGSTIEIFCLEPEDCYKDVTTAMLQHSKVLWQCLVGGAKKWKAEKLSKTFEINEEKIVLDASIVEKKNDYFIIKFNWSNSSISFAELLHYAGIIPLPPYLNRSTEEADKTTYQTIYAKHDGSVAAPTAGLHFTDTIFEKFTLKNIHTSYVTLHVGAGTFKPVKASKMDDHEMHAEYIDVSIETIQDLINFSTKTIVAIGTTSLRTIESLYWMGVKLIHLNNQREEKISIESISIQQWDAYELPQTIDRAIALKALTDWMSEKKMFRIVTKTQIIIAPGYVIRVAKGLITNFHQPQSTLLLLIAAIVGDDWKKIYDFALKNNFRFLSYGDGSLLWTN
jgi:S-adenosylmethionine:tRNA ribosyltransferase-isomerase